MSKGELEILLNEEKQFYLGRNKKGFKTVRRLKPKRYLIWKYLYFFRLCQYYRKRYKDSTGIMSKVCNSIFVNHYYRKLNIYSAKSGIEIVLDSSIGRCCNIGHGGVIINGNIGDYCTFRGNNVIGSKGTKGEKDIPVIGNKVDLELEQSLLEMFLLPINLLLVQGQ